MKRRAFMLAPVALAMAGLPSMARPALPEVETFWIPPDRKDKSDPLGQRGFAAARCTVDGRIYGKVHGYSVNSNPDGEVAQRLVRVDLLQTLFKDGVL